MTMTMQPQSRAHGSPTRRGPLADDCPSLSPARIAQIAKGLAHPARVEILELFVDGKPRIAGEIFERSDLAQSTVSEHLRVLRAAEILSSRRDGPRVWYELNPNTLRRFVEAIDAVVGNGDQSPA